MLISVNVRSILRYAKWVEVGQYLYQMEANMICLKEWWTHDRGSRKTL